MSAIDFQDTVEHWVIRFRYTVEVVGEEGFIYREIACKDIFEAKGLIFKYVVDPGEYKTYSGFRLNKISLMRVTLVTSNSDAPPLEYRIEEECEYEVVDHLCVYMVEYVYRDKKTKTFKKDSFPLDVDSNASYSKVVDKLEYVIKSQMGSIDYTYIGLYKIYLIRSNGIAPQLIFEREFSLAETPELGNQVPISD